MDVVSQSPNNVISRTLLALIGRKNIRSGMSADISRIEAARSGVRLLQVWSALSAGE